MATRRALACWGPYAPSPPRAPPVPAVAPPFAGGGRSAYFSCALGCLELRPVLCLVHHSPGPRSQLPPASQLTPSPAQFLLRAPSESVIFVVSVLFASVGA